MLRRVEFTLDLDDPTEAALYEALCGPLRHRRAGNVIRQALLTYLGGQTAPKPPILSQLPLRQLSINPAPLVEVSVEDTDRIVEQSATMFGF